MTAVRERDERIPLGDEHLEATLSIPEGAKTIIIFAHGSGSGRQSPRNRAVAREFQGAGHATLLLDLLTPDESAADARTGHLRFDIDLLAARLTHATDWLARSDDTRELAIGYFGASTGAAAALQSAAALGDHIRAVVSRGGRPDLALDCLSKVRAPTLLIVGEADVPVIPLNREALDALDVEKELAIVPGAGHLFEEPGALDSVCRLARKWFDRYLSPPDGG